MEALYLDAANGLKPAGLQNIRVTNAPELAKQCMDFLCTHLVGTKAKQSFFAQNISTHVVHLATLIQKAMPNIQTVYLSDHEIRWMKEVLEAPGGYKPDATHSNYVGLETFPNKTFSVELVPFANFESVAARAPGPALFYISHVSRLTGDTADVARLHQTIKKRNADSILMLDGAQTIGAFPPPDVDKICDVYFCDSLKFLGAEPNVGMAFLGNGFFIKLVGKRENYPAFNAGRHAKDLYSLWQNLQNPLFSGDYYGHIQSLKSYAVEKLLEVNKSILYNSPNQAANFLTLNFGSVEKNKKFIELARAHGIILSDNSNLAWSLIEPPVPLIRVGLSVKVTIRDLDKLFELIKTEAL